jgi:two-component system chemotaxis response regulator CheY
VENFLLGFSGDAGALTRLCGAYSGKPLTAGADMDEYAIDCLRELTNCINGVFASEMSNEGVELEIGLPCFYKDSKLVSNGPLVILPLTVDGYTFEIVFSVNSDVNVSEVEKPRTSRILIVDDTRVSREALKGVLESEGFEIAGEAADGQEGVNKYMELRPDLVTMDITMPVMDGIAALKKILEFDPGAKVIMVSSAGQNSKLAECLTLGASDFVAKPWEADQVIFSVVNVLGDSYE